MIILIKTLKHPSLLFTHRSLRHDAHHDEVTSFQWIEHDGRTYGQEEIKDGDMGLSISASFITKAASTSAGSTVSNTSNTAEEHSEQWEWAQRVEFRELPAASQTGSTTASLFFYLTSESSQNLDEINKDTAVGNDDTIRTLLGDAVKVHEVREVRMKGEFLGQGQG